MIGKESSMPQPNPVAFTLFNIDIMWYAVCVCLGILAACTLAYFRAPKHNLDPDRLLNFMIISIPMGIIGARAYYVLFHWDWYAGDIMAIINIRQGGLAIHGGLILGLGTAAVLCKVFKVNPVEVLDLCAPSIAIGQAIGRWGNYFNSEAHGGPTDLPWGVLIDGRTYHPTFLYESIWCLLLFFLLLRVDRNRKFTGQIILLYGMLYSCERFFVEALRTDSLMIGPFKQAQVISLVIFFICLVLYVILDRRSKGSPFKDQSDTAGDTPAENADNKDNTVRKQGDN